MPSMYHPRTTCLFHIATLCVSLSLLTACGGGGESPTTPPPALAVTYNVGGLLAGLGAGKNVTLAHVDATGVTVQSAALSANGFYALRLPAGTAYNLRVLVQPQAQTCTVSNGTGTASADVNTIGVACQDTVVAPEAKPVTGSISGMGAGKTLVLQLNADGSTQEAAVNADGSFQFATAITGSFTITVKTHPTGQTCTVANGQGVVGQSGGVPISVSCASSAYTLGGSVSGNAGVVILRNNANGDSTTVSGNGAFTFTQPVLHGVAYSVSVLDQGASQTCSVGNSTGTARADVRDIVVSCTAVVIVAPPVAVPAVPANLAMAYGVKRFNLSWDAVTAPAGGGAVNYKLFEDADGAGALASSQIGGTLSTAAYAHSVSGLLHTRLNAQYRVQACNTSGCSALSVALVPNVTQAIGYFKASNTGLADVFGNSVALSSDGSTLAVGANGEASNTTGINGNQTNNAAGSAGAVYVFIRTGGIWTQQAYVKASNTGAGDQFGWSVALSSDGNTLAVGAHGEDSSATGIAGDETLNNRSDSGAVYVYARTGVAWAQQAYVKASNNGADDAFGYAVALSGDGSTLAVGAYGEQSNATGVNGNQADNSANQSGAVYVFNRTGITWTQQAYVKASNTEANDLFGSSVALSTDGSTLAVGAFGEGSNATGINGDGTNNSANQSGAVYAFTRTGVTWTQQAYVKASNSESGDWFGRSVTLSGDGSTLAVGAHLEASAASGINGDGTNNSSGQSGAVYVFTRTGITWTQQAYVKASNTGAADQFGYSVVLSGDGSTMVVGACGEASSATGISGNQTNNSALGAGAAFVFTRTGATWTQQAYVKASNTQAVDRFGISVALSADGSTLAVGAYEEGSAATGINGDQTNNGAAQSGAVYVY